MKNKTITIYELLGLIKDDKAPKKIKHNKKIYYLERRGYFNIYEDDKGNALFSNLFQKFTDDFVLTLKVEIIKDDEFEDIEEIDSTGCTISSADVKEMATINQLIRNQRKIIERLKKDETNGI
jgi:hypothetical protein